MNVEQTRFRPRPGWRGAARARRAAQSSGDPSLLFLVATVALLSGGCSGSTEATAGGRDAGATADATADAVADAPSGDSTDESSTANLDASDGDAASDASPQCHPASGRVPLLHQPAGAACPQQRAAAASSPDASTCRWPADSGEASLCGCRTDSDCTAGQNGRCVNASAGPGGATYCSYDECFQNSDCDGGEPCICRPSSSSTLANQCVAFGNCTVDSDCGPGGFCSPSNAGPAPYADCQCVTYAPCDGPDGSGVTSIYPPAPPPDVGCYESTDGGPWVQTACTCASHYPCGQGYYCHTACDECVDDSDCGGNACVYSLTDHRWKCVEQECPL